MVQDESAGMADVLATGNRTGAGDLGSVARVRLVERKCCCSRARCLRVAESGCSRDEL